MTFSIIPDIDHLDQYQQLATKYNLNWEYGDFTSPSVYDNPEEIDRRLRIYTSCGRDLSSDTMHGAFLGVDVTALDNVLRMRSQALCEQSLQIASSLGVRGVVFHTGLIGGLRLDYYQNHWLDVSVDFWTRMAQKYPEICIYMENSFEQEPDMFVRLMEGMSGVTNFRLCLDYGHAILTKTPIETWCKTLAPYIGHCHLNDNDLIDDLHLVPGEGRIDFDCWKRLMQDNHIDGSVLIELNGYSRVEAAIKYMSQIVTV